MKIINYPIIFIVKLYKFFLSPFFPNSCKFDPSCSTYVIECFSEYNFLKASYKSLIRIVKCNPWFNTGGKDSPFEKGDN